MWSLQRRIDDTWCCLDWWKGMSSSQSWWDMLLSLFSDANPRVQEVHLCHRYSQHRDCIDCYHSKRVCRRKNSTEDDPGQYQYSGAFTQRNQQAKVYEIIRNIRRGAEDPGTRRYCTMLTSAIQQSDAALHTYTSFFNILCHYGLS